MLHDVCMSIHTGHWQKASDVVLEIACSSWARQGPWTTADEQKRFHRNSAASSIQRINWWELLSRLYFYLEVTFIHMLAQKHHFNLILERTFPASRQRTDKIGEAGEMTAEHFSRANQGGLENQTSDCRNRAIGSSWGGFWLWRSRLPYEEKKYSGGTFGWSALYITISNRRLRCTR